MGILYRWVPHIIEPAACSNAASAISGYTAAAMAHESEVYFEITIIGGSAKVVALDAATAIEVAVIGPASASQADLKKLALGKLKARLARERRDGGIS
jgi:hypothetical protein